MLIPALLSVAAALLSWPSRTGAQRLARLAPVPAASGVGRRRRARGVVAALTVSAGVVVGVAGVLVVVACGLLVAAVLLFRRDRRRARAAVEELDELASAFRGVVGELRVGTHPVAALEAVAGEASPGVAARLRALAASVRLPGSAARERGAEPSDGAVGHIERLVARAGAAWSLTARHGVPVADIVGALHRDVDTRARSARRLDARLAGARAGAAVLATLPVAGVALGEVMGAAPVHVLTGTAAGSMAFVVGAGLVLAGVAWTSRLTRQVLP